MQKIACIFSYKKSNWISCQKIVFNIHKSYQLNKNFTLLNFNYSKDSTPSEIAQTAHSIVDAKPDTLVFMDHLPHPLALLQHVLKMLNTNKPKIIFHVFGDFTLYYSQWEKLAPMLKGFEVKFIVASERQKHLIDKFLFKPMTSEVCPFPVDETEFYYNSALRITQRKDWKLKEQDIAFVFTGRLSRQKRIHLLIKKFAQVVAEKNIQNAHLFLYGHFDNIGDQFLGIWESENEYFRKINRIYKEMPEEIQARIHFMGSVPNPELKSVYQGADVLLNLSVHNDEDYGMSVAEALCSGLPVILTDWGGLASFELPEIHGATKFVPVVITDRSKKVDSQKFMEVLKEVLDKGACKTRKEISEEAHKRFGTKGCADKILECSTGKFEEFVTFTPFFDKVIRNFAFKQTPYIDNYKNITKLYKNLYSSYVRHN